VPEENRPAVRIEKRETFIGWGRAIKFGVKIKKKANLGEEGRRKG